MNDKNLDTDFNYVNQLGVSVHKEHTEIVKYKGCLPKEYIDSLNSIPFLCAEDYHSKIFSTEWDYLVYSPLNDYSRGLYKNKETSLVIPFDAFQIDWTQEHAFEERPPHLKNYPKEFFKHLAQEWISMGPISPDRFKKNMENLIMYFPNRTIVLLTGAEVSMTQVNFWEKNMHLRHKEMNEVVVELAQNYQNCKLVDVRKIVSSVYDCTDNIRHYKKKKYL